MSVAFTPAAPNTEFDKLLDQLRELADSRRMQGNYFEELVRHFLLQDGTWGSDFAHVWLWKDWPGRTGADTGADLVAQRRDGRLVAIQTKFFRPDYRVRKDDLNSFLEFVGRDEFAEGLWVDTTSQPWSANALETLKNRTKPVKRIGLEQLRHSNIDWASYNVLDPRTAPRMHELKQLRPHQHQAVSQVMAAFERGTERGKMIMACGTGKTFTALKLAERVTKRFAGGGRSTILFMVPSLALLQQTLNEWSQQHDPELPLTAFVVGSDTTVGRKRTGDITSVAIEELAAPATTNGRVLAEELDHLASGADGMVVVFSTYQSIQAVHEAQQLGVEAFDLVICDEAHRTTGVTLSDEDESSFVRVHDNDYIQATRRIYMTATPRIFNDQVKNTAAQHDAELVSMDDEALYGPELYRLSFGQAVEENLLTDYKVLVLGVSQDQIAQQFQQQVADSTYELPLDDVTKLVGCWNGMAKREVGGFVEDFGLDIEPMRRAVAFAKDIRTSQRVASEFQSLVEDHLSDIDNDDPSDDLTVQVRHVDGTMRSTQREELLDWLKEEPGTDRLGRPVARVLSNARCLSEGVDVPSLDAVLFLNPRKSQVDVVQAVGRVMRRAEGKRYGYIILPVVIPAGVEADAALNENDRYQVVWQVLQALRAHDERLDAKINQMSVSGVAPETIVVKAIDLSKPRRTETGSGREIGTEGVDELPQPRAVDVALPGLGGDFDAAWKDSVYAKIVQKVGDRMYWDDWTKDIDKLARSFITLITTHLDAPGTDVRPFEGFMKALSQTVNPEITRDEVIELVAQHMITLPIFDAMFPDRDFARENPVSSALEKVVAQFGENAGFARELEPLEGFYAKVTTRIRGLQGMAAKQQMLLTLYDKFFSKAFPRLADRLGIVFTPVPVVDYIVRSAEVLLRAAFGKSLSDEGVRILETFMPQRIQTRANYDLAA